MLLPILHLADVIAIMLEGMSFRFLWMMLFPLSLADVTAISVMWLM